MKRPETPAIMQLMLPLPTAPAAVLPSDKQRELGLALTELLLTAARQNASRPGQGGGNEPEADQ